MKKIIILCFSTGEVFVRDFPEELKDSEDWFETKHNNVDLRPKDCQWMVVDELKINIA